MPKRGRLTSKPRMVLISMYWFLQVVYLVADGGYGKHSPRTNNRTLQLHVSVHSSCDKISRLTGLTYCWSFRTRTLPGRACATSLSLAYRSTTCNGGPRTVPCGKPYLELIMMEDLVGGRRMNGTWTWKLHCTCRVHIVGKIVTT